MKLTRFFSPSTILLLLASSLVIIIAFHIATAMLLTLWEIGCVVYVVHSYWDRW